MNKEEFDSKMTSMLGKIGDEASGLILDDVAIFLSDNENMNKEIAEKDKQIADLKLRNETLQKVNGNLLQQVSVQPEAKKEEIEDKGKPYFDMHDVFDERGNFKLKM
jgi:hypothetical protein